MLRNKLRILTWHVHGNYLYYLSHVPHTFYVLTDAVRSPGYAGRAGRLPWGDNVVEVALGDVRSAVFDCVLYQSRRGYEYDRLHLLSEAQRNLPRIYLEHDPPRENPTDTRHPVNDPNAQLVHVTHFNQLMWNSGQTPSRVVEHGVVLPEGVRYDGKLARGLAVINDLEPRGRRVGADIFAAARDQVRLDLVGMESERSGGLGEIPNDELAEFMSHYRFYFHPVRWTSLGLAAIEAMMIGMPVVGLATTELVTVIRNGHSGFLDTNLQRLIEPMRRLLAHPDEAAAMGEAARQEALRRFNIDRFVADWLDVFRDATR
ncbi:MAG TPA: glycosyltransferase family 4 protein [Azonexus sp.]